MTTEDSTSYLYPLFEHMANEHGLTLLESEMHEILNIVHKIDKPAEDSTENMPDVVGDILKDTPFQLKSDKIYSQAELERRVAEAEERQREIIDLVRFLASTWAEIDDFVYKNCDSEALAKYPVIQGTRNQMDLRNIGAQKYDNNNIRKGVDAILNAGGKGDE